MPTTHIANDQDPITARRRVLGRSEPNNSSLPANPSKKNSLYITKEQLLFFVLTMLYLCLILSGIKRFEIWDQISFILSSKASVVDLYRANNPHLLRFVLIYPFALFSNYLGMELNYLFSLVIFCVLIVIYCLLSRVMIDASQTRRRHLIIYCLILIIALAMNGRIVFACFGNTILLSTFYAEATKRITLLSTFILYSFSLFLLSVSTGTFMVGVSSILLFFVISLLRRLPRVTYRNVAKLFLLVVFIACISPLIYAFFMKNYIFYDNSIILMLEHGPGKLFHDNKALVLIVMILPIMFFAFTKLLYVMKKDAFIASATPIALSAIVIGLFGDSTFFSGLPVYILVWFYLFHNFTLLPKFCLKSRSV